MEKRYRALRLIGTAYKVIGVIALALTVLAALAVCGISTFSGAAIGSWAEEYGADQMLGGFLGGAVGGAIAGLLILLYGGAMGAGLFALGELVYLLLAVEENTRLTSTVLRQLQIPRQPSASAAAQDDQE